MFRFREPERPQNYKALPHYQRPGYWHSMQRVVTVRSRDVVDVVHYTGQRLRVVAFLLMWLTFTYNIIGPLYSFGSWQAFVAEVKDDHEYVFDFEEYTRRSYRTTQIESRRERYTEDEWVEMQTSGNSNIHSYRFLNKLFGLYLIWSTSFMCIVVWLFWPKHCPVRFDRKHELAYTWHRGCFYIADISPMLGGLRGQITSEADGNPLYHMDKTTGAYGLTMQRADFIGREDISDKKKNALIRMGTYPVCHAHQNVDIEMFIKAFMSRDMFDAQGNRIPWTSDWLDKIQKGRTFPQDFLRWLGSKTFGPSTSFDDEKIQVKTEAAIMDYLTNPETRDRGKTAYVQL